MIQQAATLEIKVITGARQTKICEFLDDGSLKLKVHAKPIEWKANQELIEILSEKLNISRADIEIVRGEHSKRKVLKFIGISQIDLLQRLNELTGL